MHFCPAKTLTRPLLLVEGIVAALRPLQYGNCVFSTWKGTALQSCRAQKFIQSTPDITNTIVQEN